MQPLDPVKSIDVTIADQTLAASGRGTRRLPVTSVASGHISCSQEPLTRRDARLETDIDLLPYDSRTIAQMPFEER